MIPRGGGGVEVAAVLHDAGRGVSELVAELAALLHVVDPGRLALERGRNPVALGPGAGKLAGGWRLDQRVPVVARIELRRGVLVGGDERVEGDAVERRRELSLGRIDQAVAAHPDVVRGVRQLRQHEAALVVGHDDLGELRLELVRLGDHPDSGLRAGAALDDAADVTLRHLRGAFGGRQRRRGGNRGA